MITDLPHHWVERVGATSQVVCFWRTHLLRPVQLEQLTTLGSRYGV